MTGLSVTRHVLGVLRSLEAHAVADYIALEDSGASGAADCIARRADTWRRLAEVAELLDTDEAFAATVAEACLARTTALALARHADAEPAAAVYTAAQLDGIACAGCGGDFQIGEGSVPTTVDDGRQLFRHRSCLSEPPAEEAAAARGHGQDDIKHHTVYADGIYAPRCRAENATGDIPLFVYAVTCRQCLAMIGPGLERTARLVATAADRALAGPLTAPTMYARPNEDGRCLVCDGTKGVCRVCHKPHASMVFLDHEPVMLPCRECNGGSYPARPPTTHYAHAMTGEGAETPRCGEAGRVALFAHNVTCPRCLTMLVLAAAAEPADDAPTAGEAP